MAQAVDLTGKKFGRLTIISQFRKNRVKYVHCKCECGNERDINAYSVTSGKTVSCGCFKGEQVSKTLFKSVKGERFGNLVVIDEYMTEGYIHKCKCRCDCGNEFECNLNYLRTGKNPNCGCLRKIPPLKGKTFGKWEVLEDIYKGRHYCKCRCSCENKTEKIISASTLVLGRSKSCGCGIVDALHERFKSRVGEKHGNLLIVRDFMKDKVHYCECDCDCGKKIIVRWDDINNGSTSSCGCYQRKRVRETQYKELKGMKFGKLTVEYDFDDYSQTTPHRCHCKCECGNEIDTMAHSLLIGKTTSCGCAVHSGSKDEKEIKEFIKSIVPDEIVTKHRTILDNKEIDIYLPRFNLGIEFNGSVFHASVNSPYNDLSRTYHRDKFLCAKEKGIHLISIFDVDWWAKKEKIKSYLQFLLLPKKTIYARKCEIKEIEKEKALEFYDKYHLQSHTNMAQINIGLYYDDELVACMGVGNLRLHKRAEGMYELHRYCVKDDLSIVGGAEKLLKYFENKYSPSFILSYSDNDYFSGDMYSRLGFENKCQVTPRYYWFYKHNELKRERCQLKYLKQEFPELYSKAIELGVSNKEDYIMSNLGANKVFRSGNTRWEKKYDKDL